MAITGTNIKSLAETDLDSGTVMSTTSSIIWINACLRELGAECRYVKTASLAVTDSSLWVDLPTDYLQDYFVTDDADGEDYENGMKVRNFKAKLASTGTFTLSYFPVPQEITALGSTVLIHSMMQDAIGHFVAARFKSQDDDENRDAQRLYQEFLRAKTMALAKIDGNVNPSPDTIIDCYGGL